MNLEKYLPIGTILILKEGEKKLMITGFLAVNSDAEKPEIYDYCGCSYPEGLLSFDEVFLFNHEDIYKIFYLGYTDEEEQEFKKGLKEELEKINAQYE